MWGGNVTWISRNESILLALSFSLLTPQNINYLLIKGEKKTINFQCKLENLHGIFFLLLLMFQPETCSEFHTRRLLFQLYKCSSLLGMAGDSTLTAPAATAEPPLLLSKNLISAKDVQHFAWLSPFKSEWCLHYYVPSWHTDSYTEKINKIIK